MTHETSRRDKLHGEEAIIAVLAPLAQGFPGAFGLKDDCAVITPAPGTELVLKTDPVAEGVHFLSQRCARGHRLEGAGGQRVRPRRQGGPAHRLSDGAVVPRGADGRLADALCRRPGRGPGSGSAAI